MGRQRGGNGVDIEEAEMWQRGDREEAARRQSGCGEEARRRPKGGIQGHRETRTVDLKGSGEDKTEESGSDVAATLPRSAANASTSPGGSSCRA